MKHDNDPAICTETPEGISRRICLKMMSGTAIGGAAIVSAPALVAATGLNTESGFSTQTALATELPAGNHIPDLTINININRDDLVDWIMIENLHEHPLVLKKFAPRWVVYNQRLLDLDAMLSRQQRGRNQLEIWPNYAWNHSVRGAVRALHECSDITGNCYDASRAAQAATSTHRSLQLPCSVDSQGRVKLLLT